MSLPLEQVEPLTIQFDHLMRTSSMRRSNAGGDDEWKQTIMLLSTPDGKALIDFLKEKRDDGLYDHLIETNISSSEESNILVTTIADFKDALELLQPFLLRCLTHKTIEAFLNVTCLPYAISFPFLSSPLGFLFVATFSICSREASWNTYHSCKISYSFVSLL
jgi:hypothetical protein